MSVSGLFYLILMSRADRSVQFCGFRHGTRSNLLNSRPSFAIINQFY